MSLLLGTRVVRGPDWKGKDQDGGKGHVGTVTHIFESRVTVIWDSGREFNYIAGAKGIFELKIFNSGPTGIFHSDTGCEACSESPIIGIRWKCASCDDLDLCTRCYMTKEHDISHEFLRRLSETSPVTLVPPRSGSKRIQSEGLFVEAEVIPGPDWKYGNEEGGLLGTIKTVFSSGVVVVERSDTPEDLTEYRVGAEGKLDIIAVEETNGWKYFNNHLPVLDTRDESDTVRLLLGDKVRVDVTLEEFRRVQNQSESSDWADDMSQCLTEMGTVVGMEDGEPWVHVQYQDSKRWKLMKSLLTLVHSFSVGEKVEIISDVDLAMILQFGHGSWSVEMKEALGKTGIIEWIDSDRDLKVVIGDRAWIFSPVCCSPVNRRARISSPASVSSSTSDSDMSSGLSSGTVSSSYSGLDESLYRLLVDLSTRTQVKFIKAAASGDVNTVRELAKSRDVQKDVKEQGMAAIHVACLKGHLEVVETLFDLFVDIDLRDNDDDTPLHCAAFGNHVSIATMLLQNGVQKNSKNTQMLTPLHVAVQRKNVDCVKLLIESGCDPNTQDKDGDTPLHDAIRDGDSDVIKCFESCRTLNLKIFNTDGLNAFHVACSAMSGKTEFVSFLMTQDRAIANIPTRVGQFYPIHTAALNGYTNMVATLINDGSADVNARTERLQTALHMAVMSCNLQIVENLWVKGTDVNAQDHKGNTPLHVAMMEERTDATMEDPRKDADNDTYEIKCFLVEHGAKLDIKNHDDKTPLDMLQSKEAKVLLKRIAKTRRQSSEAVQCERLPAYWDAMTDDNEVKVVSLPEHSEEFKMVEKNMKLSLTNPTIVSIKRIQNVSMWRQYALRKENMEREYGTGLANEMTLFHGTTEDAATKIPYQNIDFRLAGSRVGAIFGRGAYFAVDAKMSDTYAKPSQNNHKFMFLAKVLLGKYKKGSGDMQKPPIVDSSNALKHADSTVDNEEGPRIFVLYSETQIYPEHQIEYK
ncbi:E3 ubiquitin-protein ligase MIB1-like [Gigantopelta aegis]|uniref:E3 ubiquitin-protein ligase MIB1-like n=1 Tax=Gigantopelta aegis TaxID=1735272 RepID=UPI001B88C9BE|nr:E3 ubiquitin-protein ligase MIB1-like [Gigantopelta aegis]XP_041378559.1 E3 ubiquitin-protein ligase MIB1-like [Gigantopelta aegis]XP_041378560.1 E3 ubiquitin-protein ligase MIB1-like [Gigantopelta aegis]